MRKKSHRLSFFLFCLFVTSALYGQTFPKDAIHKAAYGGDIEEVRKILETKPNPDDRDSFGGTALHAAMFQKNLDIARLLVENGWDVNAVGPANGYTPLHDAVWAGSLKAVEFLLDRGADPRIKGKDGLTPVEKAKREGKTAIAEFFRVKGFK